MGTKQGFKEKEKLQQFIISQSPSEPCSSLTAHIHDANLITRRRARCGRRTGSGPHNNTLTGEPHMNQNDKANLAGNSLCSAPWMGGNRSTSWGNCELDLKSRIQLGVQPRQPHLLFPAVELITSWVYGTAVPSPPRYSHFLWVHMCAS